ncbi:hypothetical protein DICPUDRAFT_89879 [Dictyostelium purpureum]|uniref:BSD domain-containing protein n=1 Tax=Dictyostelium purpureum TaxID=5786 RepID=F0ZYS4_DICPU|nr:uncharacterized protein DICPUDRAFT_89879 [Dictyostelium purpureum]EGC30894.1 hypothetical protein DICPUDRAFT_89879 [Dictyostelium purpureum]|eukprot:XP_003292567.1 hypothetical protein DICPUDRAFT_89879 [Dictyostelium purpureum]
MSRFSKEPGELVLLRALTKHSQQQGTLFFTNIRLVWVQHGYSEPSLHLKISEIKSQFISTIKSAKALLRLSVRDSIKNALQDFVFEFIHPTNARTDLNSFPTASGQSSNSTSPNSTSPTGASPKLEGKSGTATGKDEDPNSDKPEYQYLSQLKNPSISEQQIKQRVQLLMSNKELKQLYEQLVVQDKVITESDFWESRKTLLKTDSTRSERQNTGMPSNFIADVRPSTETANTIKYKFTPTVIHQIFIQHPSVEKAYKENVPLKISEQAFWRKYVQSKYFHRDRTNAPPIDDDLFSKYETDEFNKLRILKRKLIDISPLVDLSSSDNADADIHSGYGVLLDQSQDPYRLEKALPLLRRFNRHSALVLGSKDLLSSSSSSKDKITQAQKKQKEMDLESTSPPINTLYNGDDEENVTTEQMEKILENHKKQVNQHIVINDLEQENRSAPTPLKILDQKRYFEGHSSANKLTDEEKRMLIDDFNYEYTRWNQPDLGEVYEPYNKATNASKGNDEYQLPESNFKKDLFASFQQSNELLRHFWSTTYTLGRGAPPTPQQLDKNNKMSIAISKQYDKIEEKKKQLISQNKINQASLLTPILESLHKAIEKKDSQIYHNK